MAKADFRYFRVATKFWTDEKSSAWGDDNRLLALYLLTCPHRTTEGLYRLPKAYILGDLKWEAERLREPFAQLLDEGFAMYDETTQVILICHALNYQKPENPNQITAAVKAVLALPANPLTEHLQRFAQRYAEPFANALGKALGTLHLPSPTPVKPSRRVQKPPTCDENSDAFRAAETLAAHVRSASPKAKITAAQMQNWANTMRLMVEQDDRTFDEITEMIAWVDRDDFWRSNILSAKKLREQWTQLAAKKARSAPNGSSMRDKAPSDKSRSWFDRQQELNAERDRRAADLRSPQGQVSADD